MEKTIETTMAKSTCKITTNP